MSGRAKQTLFMETTEVDAGRSASEIVAELVKAGATSINTDYANGVIVGLRWVMKVRGVDQLFNMPARIEPVEKLLLSRRKGPLYNQDKLRIHEQARRVAWRQLLRWIQAQMAMIQCGMAESGEVFFAYLQSPGGQSIFEVFAEQGLRMLPPGEPRPQ
jgi:hypothetical protein